MTATPHRQDIVLCRIALIVLAILWLALFPVLALRGPFDGYYAVHLARGDPFSISIILAKWLTTATQLKLSSLAACILESVLLAAIALTTCFVTAFFLRPNCREAAGRWRWPVLLLAVAVSLGNILNLPFFANDIYLYRLYGGILSVHHANPYLTAPPAVYAAPALGRLPFPDQHCAYGPLALMLFAAFSGGGLPLHVSFWLMKLALLFPVFPLLGLLYAARSGDNRPWLILLLLTALNPLIQLEVLQNGHLEGWIALFLVIPVAALKKGISLRSVLLAGLFCGLAAATKISMLLVAAILSLYVLVRSPFGFGRRLGLAVVISMTAVGICMLLYLPFWEGWRTLDGALGESGKIIRSLHAVLLTVFHWPDDLLLRLSLAGNILALLAGALLIVRRHSLESVVVSSLLIHLFLGRTFFQPWYLVPLLVIGFISLSGGPAPSLSIARFPFLLLLSACSTCAYVPLLMAGPETGPCNISFAIVALPFVIRFGILIAKPILAPTRRDRSGPPPDRSSLPGGSQP